MFDTKRLFPLLFATLALSLSAAPEGRAGILFDIPDARGDHLGIHDISELIAAVNGTNLDLTVRFFNPITDSQGANTGANDLFGFLDIDVDRDPATGWSSSDLLAFRSFGTLAGLGADVYTDLFQEQPGSPGLIPLIDRTGGAIDWIPIVYGSDSHSVTISVPWADLGFSNAGDVMVNAGYIALDDTTVPNAPFVSDRVSSLQGSAVPEPGTLVLLGIGLGALAGYDSPRRKRVGSS